jgi:glycosyltransferase involved in cell wall biosynthesis
VKIVIDARWVFPEISGIGLYTTELIRHLAQIDTDNTYVLLFNESRLANRTAEATRCNAAPNFELRLVNYGLFSLRNQLALPRLLADLHADLYHSPNYMIPLRGLPSRENGSIRCVVTLHDVIPLKFPSYTPRSLKRRLFPVYRHIMNSVARRADAIVTVSQTSRNDVLECLKVPSGEAGKVKVIYNGVAERYRPAAREAAPDMRTLLYVGRMDPYKNLLTLIEAFARAREDGLDDVRLRVIGSPDKRYLEPVKRVVELGLDEVVDWDGYVDDDALCRAYQSASVLVVPSRYEGFGLPVLECMACGVPVICSTAGALPEVAGDAAEMVDPDHVEDMAKALHRVLDDPAVWRRLADAGLARAAEFSWTRAARETLAVYESLARPSAEPKRGPA